MANNQAVLYEAETLQVIANLEAEEGYDFAKDQSMVGAGEALLVGHHCPAPFNNYTLDLSGPEPVFIETPATPALTSLEGAKISALDKVESLVRVRLSEVYTAEPLREIVYVWQGVEASRYLSDPSPDPIDFPRIDREATRSGQTHAEVAALWDTRQKECAAAERDVEDVRMTAIEAIKAASDEVAINTALGTAETALMALKA